MHNRLRGKERRVMKVQTLLTETEYNEMYQKAEAWGYKSISDFLRDLVKEHHYPQPEPEEDNDRR